MALQVLEDGARRIAEVYRDCLNCEAVRAALWPLEEPTALSEEARAARMHLGHCPACREYFARDAALVRAIRLHGAAGRAPASLHRRVRQAIESEAGGRQARKVGNARSTRLPTRVRAEAWAVAAALVVFFAAAVSAGGNGSDGIPEAYARDFLNRAAQVDALDSPDPEAVSGFFRQEMGVGVQPVALDDGRLTRAMVRLLEDRQVAVVEYKLGSSVIVHYRMPSHGEPPAGRPRFHASTTQGVSIVTWRDPVFEHALVGDLPLERLATLARRAFSDPPGPVDPPEMLAE